VSIFEKDCSCVKVTSIDNGCEILQMVTFVLNMTYSGALGLVAEERRPRMSKVFDCSEHSIFAFTCDCKPVLRGCREVR